MKKVSFKTASFVLVFSVLSVSPWLISSTLAGDWLHWRGPEQTGASPETGLPDKFSPALLDIEKVDARRVDTHKGLRRAGNGHGQLFQLHYIRTAIGMNANRLHELCVFSSCPSCETERSLVNACYFLYLLLSKGISFPLGGCGIDFR